MTTFTTKALMFALITLWLGVFGITLGYAITLFEAQKLLASDGAEGDVFGFSVSISGDTAVIGARTDDNGRNSGSAYVFIHDDKGVWREQQKLLASDGAASDFFGESVSISGDTTVIGALGNDDNGDYSGSAYVFERDGTGVWREQQKLNASDGAARDNFGRSVSIAGGTAVIGARRSGSAYVYVRDGAGVWNEQQKLIASDGAAGKDFGQSISISGDTVVIGAWAIDNRSDFGSAYVFVRDSAGVWSEQQKLLASDGAAWDLFGASVSISEDTTVIGALWDDDNGFDSGSAYVYVRDGTGVWHEQQKLTSNDGAAGDDFGDSVSIFGGTAVIGSRWDDDNGYDSGSAYVFVRDGAGVWREQQKLTASDGSADAYFGQSVSISGDTAVIGAAFDDDNGRNLGSAYVFEASNPNNDLLTVEKLINHRVRPTPGTAAQLLAGTRYRADYKVTNNSPDRLTQVQVFEGGELVCDVYALEPGESRQRYRCANNQTVLAGNNNLPATVRGKVAGSSQVLTSGTNEYYNGLSNVLGKLRVTHYVNGKNADTQAAAVDVNGNQADATFRVENTGQIELYRVNTFHDPASPINSGWQKKCFIGTLDPGQVRYCKRTVSVTHEGLNKAFGRAQGVNANVSAAGFVNASNPTYFNVVLP